MKAYEEAKAAQDKLKAEQITNANPLKGIVDAKNLAVEQPFEVVENDNNLVSINGAAPQDNLTERTDFANDWSSANTYRFTNLDGSNPNLSLKYKDAAVDKETGRKLTAQVDVVRFVSNPNGAPYNADGCDATVTKVTPPPAPETPEPGKPTEPAKPQEPKSIEKAKAETGATGYGDSGLSPMTAAGIGLVLIGSVGATTVAVRSAKKRKASAE